MRTQTLASFWSRAGGNLLSRSTAVLANLALVVVVARRFGKTEVAAIALLAAAAMLMDLCKGLGLGSYLLKRLPQLAGPHPDAGRLVRTFLFYGAAIPALLGLLLAASAPAAAQAILHCPRLAQALQWGLLANFSTVLVNNNLHIWIASGNCSGYAWQTAVTAFLQRLLPAAGLLLLDWDLPQLLAWSAAAGFVAVAASAWLPLRLAFSGTGFVGFSAFWPESRHYYFSSLIKAGAGQFDQFLAPVLMAPESMAVYYLIRRFYSLAVLAIDAVVEVQVPALSRTAGRDVARVRRHLQLLLAGVALVGGTGAALLAGNGLSLVQLLFGPGYGQHPWLITSFALCAFCYGLYVYLQLEMFLLFEPQCTTRLTTVTAVANCIAGPLAGWMLGMHGLPLAMAASFLFALDRIGNFRNRAECPWPVLLSLLVLISGAGLTGAAAAGMGNAVIRVVLVNTAIAAMASTLLFRRAQLLRRSL